MKGIGERGKFEMSAPLLRHWVRMTVTMTLVATGVWVTSCSRGDNDSSPTVRIDSLELIQLLGGRIDEAVAKGIVGAADKQFLGNIRAGDDGLILVGNIKYPEEKQVFSSLI
jgi:hypothetical protein